MKIAWLTQIPRFSRYSNVHCGICSWQIPLLTIRIWTGRDSNPRPLQCRCSTLPTEPPALNYTTDEYL